MPSGIQQQNTGLSEPPAIDAAEIQASFRRIEESEHFRSAPMMRGLLVYLWNHRTETVSEYAIGREALGRRPEFDPRADASVRVQIARLRAKLKEFDENEGKTSPLRLAIPLGGHQLEWRYTPPARPAAQQEVEVTAGEAAPPAADPPRSIPKLAVALALACAALAIFSLFLARENRKLRAAAPAPKPAPAFWRTFLSGGKPTNVVIYSPIHFIWPGQEIQIRDLKVTDFADWQKSDAIRKLAAQWGPPTRGLPYVFGRDLFAATRLLEYLRSFGPVELLETSQLSVARSDLGNTVYIGGPRTTRRFRTSFSQINFDFESVSPTVIRNRSPKPGEPAQFAETVESNQRRTCPGIITMLPTAGERGNSLLLAGKFATTLASMLVTKEGLLLIEREWIANGRPRAWEMVVQAEINDETVLRTWPVAFRPIVAANP